MYFFFPVAKVSFTAVFRQFSHGFCRKLVAPRAPTGSGPLFRSTLCPMVNPSLPSTHTRTHTHKGGRSITFITSGGKSVSMARSATRGDVTEVMPLENASNSFSFCSGRILDLLTCGIIKKKLISHNSFLLALPTQKSLQ